MKQGCNNDKWTYFIKPARTQALTVRKSEPRTFRKSGPYTKIDCMNQRLISDKFEGADFNYGNNFLKF